MSKRVIILALFLIYSFKDETEGASFTSHYSGMKGDECPEP
jgi:hypothetical protein